MSTIILVTHPDGERRPLRRGLVVRTFDSFEDAAGEASRRNKIAEQHSIPLRYEAVEEPEGGR